MPECRKGIADLKKILWAVLAVFMMAAAPLCTHAEGTGSIEVSFPSQVSSGSIAVSKTELDGTADLEDQKTIEAAAKSAVLVDQKPISSANVTFQNLSPGIYYVWQPEASDGYYPFKPFLLKVEEGCSNIVDAVPKMQRRSQSPDHSSPSSGTAAARKTSAAHRSSLNTSAQTHQDEYISLMFAAAVLSIFLLALLKNQKKAEK